jgi:hypothetical protein
VGGALPALPERTAAKTAAPAVPVEAETAEEVPAAPAVPDEAETAEEVPSATAVTPRSPLSDEPDKPAPRPRPLREKPRTRSAAGPAVGAPSPTGARAAASSRVGGAVLIGLAVLAIVVVVLVLFVFNGDDGASPVKSSATATPTATATQATQVGQLALKGTGAARAATGALALFAQQKQLFFALQVKGMPPTPSGDKYALWLSGPGSRARWIGDVPNVGKDRVLQVQGPRANDKTFTQDLARYRQILITLQTGAAQKRPGPTLVRGTLPRGSG